MREIARHHHAKALSSHLGLGETVLIERAADAFIAKRQLLLQPGTPRYRELCFRLRRAQIEFLERVGERKEGNYAGLLSDPIVVRPAAGVEVAKPGETIPLLFDRYAKENPKRIAEATLNQARRDIATFTDLVGVDFPATKLDNKAVREWKALLQGYPVKAADMLIFKGVKFRDVITKNAALEHRKPVIGHKTVNRYMAGFGAFCNWLTAHDYIAANPFTDMYLTVDKTTSTKTFSPEALKTLFASPGLQPHLRPTPAALRGVRRHHRWLAPSL